MNKKFVRTGSCNQCGDCCKTGFLMKTTLSTREFLLLKRYGMQDLLNRFMKCKEERRCPFLRDLPSDTTMCVVHNRKPRCCRLFPAHPDDIKNLPNCGYSFEEIV